MKSQFPKDVLLIFVIGLSCLSCAIGRSAFATQNREAAALAIQQTFWTKGTFSHAEKKLAKVAIGMSASDFSRTMEITSLYDNVGILTVVAEGLLNQACENVENAKVGRTQTYVFGYVDTSNIAHEKYFAAARNGQIVAKIRLEDYQWNEPTKPLLDGFLSNKNEYLRALEHVRDIKPGMWSGEFRRIMQMVPVWSGQNVHRMEVIQSAGEFLVWAPGYLHEKFVQTETEYGETQQFVFGYEDHGTLVPGFVVHLTNLQVSHVEYLYLPR